MLLQGLARDPGRLVLLVTHSLRFLDLYDSVVVLSGGKLAYAAHPADLNAYFNVSTPEEVYPALASRSPQEWAEDWVSSATELEQEIETDFQEAFNQLTSPLPDSCDPVLPGFWSQTATWFSRRLKLFFRDHTQALLQLALLLVFPAVISLFAYQGLPAVRNMDLAPDINVVEQLRESLAFTVQSSRIGTLVSGLAMFQVILLALMGSNNAAREVVSDRLILEKEKLAGLRPESALAGMGIFLLLLVTLQSAWMTLFVRAVCQFPGDLFGQFLPFALVTAAMTALCLAISSWTNSSEQASLGSLYLVGFQLPLSGVILALPEFLAWLIRPMISAYWAWSGYIQTLKDSRFYDLISSITETPVASYAGSLWLLGVHLGLGLFLSYAGIRRSAWR